MEALNSPPKDVLPLAAEILAAATTNDIDDVQRLLQEASDFKRSQGDDLWGEVPFTREEVAGMVATGNLYVLRLDGVAAASVLLPVSDERMWGDAQGGDDSAIYIHKLCVGDAFRGQGLGGTVLTLAEDLARNTGKFRLRLDCPYDNRPLCEYYEGQGFREVRRYDRPSSAGRRNPNKDVYRAALYEKELA